MSEQTIIIPELTEEQREIISLQWRESQRQKYLKEGPPADPDKPTKVRKLYLVSFNSNAIAFPDEHGRAVHHQCVYAWVEMKEGAREFYSGQVEVVAQGDGRWLKTPVQVILSGHSVVALAEVNPDVLHL